MATANVIKKEKNFPPTNNPVICSKAREAIIFPTTTTSIWRLSKPGLTGGMINTNVFFYVHEIFVPIAPNNFSVVGFTDFLDIIEKTQKKKSKRKDGTLKISYILSTKRDLRKRTSESLLEQIKKIAHKRVPGAIVLEPIPECSKTEECSIFRQSIVEYEPNSRGGRAYLKAIVGVLNGKHKTTKRAG